MQEAEASRRPGRIRAGPAMKLWHLVMEGWVFGVLLSFFIIRMLGSSIARRLLEHISSH